MTTPTDDLAQALPELPEPFDYIERTGVWNGRPRTGSDPVFDDDQMRAYAIAAIRAHESRAQPDESAPSRIGIFGGRRTALEDMANTPELRQKLRDLLGWMDSMEAHDNPKERPSSCEPDEPKSDPRAQQASVAGWRVIPYSGTVGRAGDRWEVYDPTGSGGAGVGR